MDTTRAAARTCGDDDVAAGRGPGQLGWYAFARRFARGKAVLDVGCGLGDGLRLLKDVAATALGQDLDPRLAGPDVQIVDVARIAARSYDVVVSIDVVEHVADPGAFVALLARIAREGVFLTTPNWTASRCRWPYHLREYTPREFEELLRPHGRVELYKGTPDGSAVYPVRLPAAYHAFNALRNRGATAFAARCVNRLLPAPCRIHSHNAAWLLLEDARHETRDRACSIESATR